MEITVSSFALNAGLLSLVILIIEYIKKFQKPETITEWKKKKLYSFGCMIVSLPMSIIVCLKDGVFRPENHITEIIGWCFLTFITFTVCSSFFYEAILKKLVKKKDEISE